tara:strand:+ start:5029 stop:6462 length:1434 start_codon:yes stop_codon:yes gene_type:complete
VEDEVPSRWEGPGGYKEVFKLALPMILSFGSWSLMHFIDRVFLAWYDSDTLAAALPAGILSFTLGTFFLGMAGYVNTFVAQYSGANRPERVGASVWQGIHFSVFAGVLLLFTIPLAPWIFEAVGHEPVVQAYEVTYFRILMAGWIPGLLVPAISSFFSGRGDTKTVMWVNIVAAGVNVVLDYAFIFGRYGIPEMGIEGAAWASVLAQVFGTLLFAVLFLRKPHRDAYCTLSAWRLDWPLLRRMIRFGAPNGIQFFVELGGFTLFVLVVGRLGTVELAATNVAFNINTLAFLPMVGLGVAVSTLVGQYLGKDDPATAERSTWSAVHLSLVYMGLIAASYVLTPWLYLAPYEVNAAPGTFEPIRAYSVVLLRFVAAYSLLDGLYIVFSAAVKGAGDTRFVMWVTLIVSASVMVVPVWVGVTVFGMGLYTAWCFATAYLIILAICFYYRFKGGKWKSMRVIEPDVHPGLETMREPDAQTI